MKILGTGLNGLVGSRIIELLSPQHEFVNISRSTGVDITDSDSVDKIIENSDAQVVLHLAAKADVDGCEKDKEQGNLGEAWKINVIGTKNVFGAAKKTGKKFIYISTDFVYSGDKPQNESYSESEIPNPVNWYGQTKYEGEKILVESDYTNWIVARISYPYRAKFSKNDFVRAMLGRMQNNQSLTGVTDHLFNPTFIDDIASALNLLIGNNSSGIYHVVGSQTLSPYEAACKIRDEFGFINIEIRETQRDDFFKDRAARPYNLSLKNDKITELGIHIKTFDEGLRIIKNQI